MTAAIDVAPSLVTSLAWSIAWIGAGLLLLAGTAKVRAPAAAADSLALAGLPDRPGLARLLGVGEVVLAVAVLATSHVLAVVTLAVAYAVFTGISWWLLRTDQGSCGCFGEVDAPLSRVHVATNATIAIAAAGAASTAAPLPDTIGGAVLLVVVVATGAAVVRMLLVLVPALADGIQRLATS